MEKTHPPHTPQHDHHSYSNPLQAFKDTIRTYMLRMLAMSQQFSKFALMHPLDDLDQVFSRLLHSQQIKQSTIYELTNVQIRSDQHCLLVMTLLYDLAKWAYDAVISAMSQAQNIYLKQMIAQSAQTRIYFLAPLEKCLIESSIIQCIYNQSINLLKQDKKHPTLISKQNELIRILLQLIPTYIPIFIIKSLRSKQNAQWFSKEESLSPTLTSHSLYANSLSQYIQNYLVLYSYLKETKQAWPTSSKDEVKKNYNKGVQDSLKNISYIFSFVNTLSTHAMLIQNKNIYKDQDILALSEIAKHSIRFIESIHHKVSQDIYKLIYIFSTLNLNNSLNSSTLNNSQVISTCLNIYPEVSSLYNCNFSEVLLSRLKIIKLVIDLLATATDMNLTHKLIKLFPLPKPGSTFTSSKSLPSQSPIFNLPQLAHKLHYNQQILHKTAHTLIQTNYYTKLNNYYIFGIVYSIYENLMRLLLKRQSMVPLYLYTHVIINNLRKIMEINNGKYNINSSGNSGVGGLGNNNNNNNTIIPQLHLHLSSSGPISSSSLSQYSQLVILQSLLSQIANIFKPFELEYFLKLYDWNFMEEDICLNSIKYLYEFIEDEDNEGRVEYELFKKSLAIINKRIQEFLVKNDAKIKEHSQIKKVADHHIEYSRKQGHILQSSQTIPIDSTHKQKQKQRQEENILHKYSYKSPNKQRKQFYQLKKKQYLNFVQKINKKPKQIFKTIQQFNTNQQSEIKQDYIQKCVRILKKSKDIENKSMIDFLAANTPQSLELLEKYIETFIRYTKSGASTTSTLEHFLRYIISNFFLSGQSQQVVRFIDTTTTEFFKHQSSSNNIFKDSDSVYTFANAIIILNTDQHNPKNDNKMSEESFLKMCEKINCGENLDVEMIKQIYKNIKESQIHTYRNRYNMEKINLECWLDIVNDYENVWIGYYDDEMAEIASEAFNEGQNQGKGSNGFREYANQLLLSVIDQKETQKLQIMVERFQYDDRKFDCEIIDKIRDMISSKKHMAMHILQKIYEQANFTSPNKKIDDKMISYCWLAAGVIQNFHQVISYSKIAEYLLKTWRVSFELRDNLNIRQNLEFKSIRKMLKDHKKKQSKKSIMDMFSKFLSSKDSQNQSEEIELQSPTLAHSGNSNSSGIRKRANITSASFNILKLLMSSNDSRTRAAQTTLFSLRHQQSRRYEQFMSCLYLIFHLIYGEPKSRKLTPQTKQSSRKSLENSIGYQCMEIIMNLLYDFFSITQPHKIGSRISTLKTKSTQKYDLIYTYTQYWSIKILFQWAMQAYGNTDQDSESQEKLANISQKIVIIYNKCDSLFAKINTQLLNELVSILDEQEIGFDFMIQKLQIPKQTVASLKSAIQTQGLKLKHIVKSQTKDSQPTMGQSKSQPNLTPTTQTQNYQEVQKYMKELNNTSKSQSQIKNIEKENLPTSMENVAKLEENDSMTQKQEDIQKKLKEQLRVKAKGEQQSIQQNEGKGQKQGEKSEQKQSAYENIDKPKQDHLSKAQQQKQKQQNLEQTTKNEDKNLFNEADFKQLLQKQQSKQGEGSEQLSFPVFML